MKKVEGKSSPHPKSNGQIEKKSNGKLHTVSYFSYGRRLVFKEEEKSKQKISSKL